MRSMSQLGNSAWSWALVSTRSGRWTAIGPTAAYFTGNRLNARGESRRNAGHRRRRWATTKGKSKPNGGGQSGQLGNLGGWPHAAIAAGLLSWKAGVTGLFCTADFADGADVS